MPEFNAQGIHQSRNKTNIQSEKISIALYIC